MVELHSNFTIDGSMETVDAVYPTNHAEHETVEITHGFNDWFECGFYIFRSITEGPGLAVGGRSHSAAGRRSEEINTAPRVTDCPASYPPIIRQPCIPRRHSCSRGKV